MMVGCGSNHMKLVNTLFRQNAKSFSVKSGGTNSYYSD
jgi:hypothetical protein